MIFDPRALADPKPTRRRATPAGLAALKAEVVARQEGRCLGCGRYLGRALNPHHLAGGSSKEDVLENLVGLGGSGVSWCHGIITTRHDGDDCTGRWRTYDDVAGEIRDRLTAAQIRYLVDVKGVDWLDHTYPRPTRRRETPC